MTHGRFVENGETRGGGIAPEKARSMAGRLLKGLCTLSRSGALVLAVACDTGVAPPLEASGAPSPSAAPRHASSAEAVAPATLEGSTIATSPRFDSLFVADEDQGVLLAFALPLARDARPTRFEMPGRPAQLVVTERRVFVTVRDVQGQGALIALAREGATGLSETGRVELAADAWGITLASDERTALVTSGWTHTLSRVDLDAMRATWTTDVAREPRSVTILPQGNRAYVTHLVGADVTRVDDVAGATPTAKRVAMPASPDRSPAGEELDATLGYAITHNPEGDRVFLPRHALGAHKRDMWFGAATVDVFDVVTERTIAGRREAGSPSSFIEPVQQVMAHMWWSANENVVAAGAHAFSQPRAVRYRKSEKTLLVASEGGDAIAELDATMSNPSAGVVRSYLLGRKVDPYVRAALHGGAPSGIALSADEKVAYVHCRSTDEIAIIDLVEGDGVYAAVPPRFVALKEEKGERDYVMGRRLFYNARDGIVSGGMACAGCHPDGRDDGHVWHEATFEPSDGPAENIPFDAPRAKFTNFFATASAAKKALDDWNNLVSSDVKKGGGAGFPRQTPMIAGRVSAHGPYGWLAENPDVPSRIEAGFKLHRWGLGTDEGTKENAVARATYLTAFVRKGLVPPPRPRRTPTDEEKRGEAIFLDAKTECATCHAPATEYTNRAPALLVEGPVPPGFVREPNAAYRVPSLLFVGGTPPYFHDGRFSTLDALVVENANRMGKTDHLSDEDKRALVAFLKTL